MSGYRAVTAWVVFWLIIGALYFWGAVRQMDRLNLSAAAGGQYPYLTCAKKMAEVGVTRYLGDRNRMPLYPAMLTLVYGDDWDGFVRRSSWFTIVSSMIVLIGIGGISYHLLRPWSAMVLTLAATFCAFLGKASFVQAELLYYGLLTASWLLLCRLLRRPSPGWAIVAGVLLGLTYLTKASALPAVVAFLVVAGVLAIVLAIRKRGDPSNGGTAVRASSVLITGALTLLAFLAVAYPYISDNKAQFDRYFYNVNSRFFMWCDSWAEAKAFADTHRITEHYPTAPAEEMPGPVNYWQAHTGGQILRRLGAGFAALGSLALSGTYFKYLAFAVAICIGLGVKELRRVRELRAEDWSIVAFCALLLGGYVFAFAWYAQVAYGDRFILSLLIPIMFAALWLSDRLSASARPFSLFGIRVRTGDVLAGALAMLLVGEGSTRAITSGSRPMPAFVSFYYNESQELLRTGNPREAEKGFAGVVRLDPTFAPAHHALGMIAMNEQRFDDAVTHLTEAVRLEPRGADGHNSLGSALVQAGRLEEAVAAFEEAVRLDPGLAVAWFNLGGTYCRLDRFEEAQVIRKRLDQLHPDLARRLDSIIGD